MGLLQLSDHDRAVKFRNHALAVDDNGREILIGLDRQQSEWLLASIGVEIAAMPKEDRERFLKLYEKHEVARLEAAGTVPTRAIDF